MGKIPDTVNYDIAKIWLAHQDLKSLTPEETKEMFFKCLHDLEAKNVERWD